MKWIVALRTRYWHYRLKQHMDRVQSTLPWVGWNRAKYVGVVFDARTEEAFDRVRTATEHWKEQGKVVKLLGYTGMPRDKHSIFSGRQMFFIDDLAWDGTPARGDALEFIQTEFDVVINLDPDPHSPNAFVLAHSRASLRVGPPDAASIYALMMPMDPSEMDRTLRELETYLLRIIPS
jgi:hypothetical protein